MKRLLKARFDGLLRYALLILIPIHIILLVIGVFDIEKAQRLLDGWMLFLMGVLFGLVIVDEELFNTNRTFRLAATLPISLRDFVRGSVAYSHFKNGVLLLPTGLSLVILRSDRIMIIASLFTLFLAFNCCSLIYARWRRFKDPNDSWFEGIGVMIFMGVWGLLISLFLNGPGYAPKLLFMAFIFCLVCNAFICLWLLKTRLVLEDRG